MHKCRLLEKGSAKVEPAVSNMWWRTGAIYLPLWAQMTIISLIVSVTALLTISAVVGVHTWGDGKQLARERLHTVSGMYAMRLRDQMDTVVLESSYMVGQNAFARAVEGYFDPTFSISVENSLMDVVSKYARTSITSAGGYRAITVFTRNFEPVYNLVLSDGSASLSSVLASLEILSPEQDPNFNMSYFKNERAYTIPPILTTPTKGEPFFSMSVSFALLHSAGYITVVLDTQRLVDKIIHDSAVFLPEGIIDVVILHKNATYPGFRYAAANKNKLISTSDALFPFKSYPAIGHMADMDTPQAGAILSKAWMSTRTPNIKSAAVGCSRTTIYNTDWVICAQTTRKSALSPVKSLRNRAIGLSFGMLGFILLMVIPTGRLMTAPLYSIYGQMKLSPKMNPETDGTDSKEPPPVDSSGTDAAPENEKDLAEDTSSSTYSKCWKIKNQTWRRILWFAGIASTPKSMGFGRRREPIHIDPDNFQVPHKIEPLNRKVYRDELDRLVFEYNGLVDELNTQYYYLEDEVKARTMEAQEARIEAEKANLAKSQFIANITHELRTPLNGIMGMTSVTLSEESIPKIQVALGIILKSGRTLMKLLNELLAFSRSQVDMEPNLSEFCPQVIFANLENMLNARPESDKKDIPLSFVYRCDPPSLMNAQFMGDGHRISQICLHLFSNAIKFSSAGDRITALIRYVSEQKPHINLTPYAAQGTPTASVGTMEIVILDSGQGIDSSHLEKIFEPFVQGDDAFSKKYDGTGLGMSMCKQLAGTIGASLGVWSTKGKGTCCILEVPVLASRGIQPSGPLDINRNGMFYTTSTGSGIVTKFIEDPHTAKRISILSMEESTDASSMSASLQVGTASMTSGGVSSGISKDCEASGHQKKRSVVSSIFSGFLRSPQHHGHMRHLRHFRGASASSFGSRVDPDRASTPSFSAGEVKQSSISPTHSSTLAVAHQNTHLRAPSSYPENELSPTSSFNDIIGVKVQGEEINQFLESKHPDYKVLVADDNALNLEIMVKMLKRVGIDDVHTATDGEAVVKLVERSIKDGFHYSVIFMDLSMPRLDGFQATHIIRRTLAYPYPIVALTGYSDQRTRRMCDSSNIQEILVKPVLREALISVLAKYDSSTTEQSTLENPKSA